jgi:hypothetical protein
LFSKLIASLTNRDKIATLASDRAAGGRLLKILYWMRAAEQQGYDLGTIVDEALVSYADVPEHRALVRDCLLRDYEIATKLGCLDGKNLSQLRRGRLRTATKGPVSRPAPLTRRKGGRPPKRQAALAKRPAHGGVLTLTAAETLRSVAGGRVYQGASPTLASVGSPPSGSLGGGAADPRAIIPRVHALSEHMEDWERRTSVSLEAGEYTSMQAAELVSRAEVQATMAINRAEEDGLSVQHLHREMSEARERLNEARGRARKAAELAMKTRQAAVEAIAHWNHQLHVARQWLARAQAAEATARAARDAALAALSRARYELSQAEAELSAARHRVEPCGRDEKGQTIYRPVDTSAYERAVDAAEQRVRSCEHYLAAAEAALARAVAERQAAEARVDACTRALEAATEGEAIATHAAEQGALAESFADRGREECERADEVTRRAAARVDQEVEATGEMRKQVADARRQQASAQSSLSRAYELQSDARNRSCQGRMEMEWRLEQLRAFDAPLAVF